MEGLLTAPPSPGSPRWVCSFYPITLSWKQSGASYSHSRSLFLALANKNSEEGCTHVSNLLTAFRPPLRGLLSRAPYAAIQAGGGITRFLK